MNKIEALTACRKLAADLQKNTQSLRLETALICKAPKAAAYLNVLDSVALMLECFAKVEIEHDEEQNARIDALTHRIPGTDRKMGIAAKEAA